MSIGAGALALFAVWTLASSRWSGAPGRALLEFDRTLLYLAAFVVSGLFAARAGDLAVVLRWTAAAACGVCIVALATRLAPGRSRPPARPATPGSSSRSPTGTALARSPPSASCSRSTSRRRSASRRSRACSPPRRSRPSPSASTSRSRAAAASRWCSASRSTSCSATRAGSCRRSSRWSRPPPSRSSARSMPISSLGGALRAAGGRRATRRPAHGRGRLRGRGGAAARRCCCSTDHRLARSGSRTAGAWAQARRRLARRVHCRRCRGGRRARARRASASRADCEAAAVRR